MSVSVKFNSDGESFRDQISPLNFTLWFLFVKLSVSGFKWQASLVLVCGTWHLYGWMQLNGSNISPPFTHSFSLRCSLSAAVVGYHSFVVEMIMAAIKEARWKEASILTSVHLSSPHSLCPSPSLWFHIPPLWTMNRPSHLFFQTMVFTTLWLCFIETDYGDSGSSVYVEYCDVQLGP